MVCEHRYGILAGGYSETCSQLLTCISYDPETNINYELGFKGDLLDGMLRFNASLFTTDYEDFSEIRSSGLSIQLAG